MNRAAALMVQPGDVLAPTAAYNATARAADRLPPLAIVSGVRSDALSQTGVVFAVTSLSGRTKWLDAGCFDPPPGVAA